MNLQKKQMCGSGCSNEGKFSAGRKLILAPMGTIDDFSAIDSEATSFSQEKMCKFM